MTLLIEQHPGVVYSVNAPPTCRRSDPLDALGKPGLWELIESRCSSVYNRVNFLSFAAMAHDRGCLFCKYSSVVRVVGSGHALNGERHAGPPRVDDPWPDYCVQGDGCWRRALKTN